MAAAGGLGAEAWPCCLAWSSGGTCESPGWVSGSVWTLSLQSCRAGVSRSWPWVRGREAAALPAVEAPFGRSVPLRARPGPRLGGQLSATASVPGRTSTRQPCLAGAPSPPGVGHCDSGEGSLSGQGPGPSWLGDPGQGREYRHPRRPPSSGHSSLCPLPSHVSLCGLHACGKRRRVGTGALCAAAICTACLSSSLCARGWGTGVSGGIPGTLIQVPVPTASATGLLVPSGDRCDAAHSREPSCQPARLLCAASVP